MMGKRNYKVLRKLEVFYTGGAVRLSSDCQLLACACGDEVKVVEVASGAVVKAFPGDSESITALALSPDGCLLFAASRSLQLRCWSLESGQAVRSYKGHRAPIADMVVDSTNSLLATASADRTVRVWDVDGGFCTHSFAGHSGVALRVLFHPKQLMLVSAGSDAEVRVWDLVTKSCTGVLKGHFSAVTSLSLSPDGWTLLSGGHDSVVIVWNIRDHSKLATIPVYEAVEGVAYLPPNAAFPGLPSFAAGAKAAKSMPVCFATGGENGVVKLWRSDTGMCIYEQPSSVAVASSAAGGVVELALLPGAAGLLTATQDCRLLFHRPAGASLEVARQLIGNNDEITDMRFVSLGTDSSAESSSGRKGKQQQHMAGPVLPTHLAVTSNSDQIRLFDAATMNCTATLIGHTGAVLALDVLQLSGGTALLASAGKDAAVRLWSLPAACCIGVGAGHVSAVSCVAFARQGGGFVASGGTDKLLKLWDTTGVALDAEAPAKLRVTAAVAAHDKDINAVAVAPNDSVICTGSQDRTAKIWKLPNLVLSLTLKGHRRGIWAVAFSSFDQAVATASGDKTVRLWSLSDGTCLRTFEGHLASVLRLDFLSAGTQMLSAGADGLIKLWSVCLSECINTFDAHDDKVWALALGGPSGNILASGGGDGAIALWEDCTAVDADEAAALAEQAMLKEQDLANALKDEDYGKAAALAFEMRQPGRLLAVVRQVLERGPQDGSRTLERLAATMSGDDLQQCLEYCREWNASVKHCHAAQAMLQAVLRSKSPQELMAVPGAASILEGLLPYTQRHFARADRLLRSTFLCDYILAASGILEGDADERRGNMAGDAQQHKDSEGAEVAQPQRERRHRPVRTLLGSVPPAAGNTRAKAMQAGGSDPGGGGGNEDASGSDAHPRGTSGRKHRSQAYHQMASLCHTHVSARPLEGAQRAKPAPKPAIPRHGLVAQTQSAQIADQVAEKEAFLASLFEPGKPQPRAAQVAHLRKEIAALRTQLHEGLGGVRVTSARPASVTPSIAAAAPYTMSAAAPSGAAAVGRLVNALKLVEAQLAVSRQVDAVSIGELSLEQQQDLLALQDENTFLKAKLDVVLARQAQLQSLADQHGISSNRGSGSGSSSTFTAGNASTLEWPAHDRRTSLSAEQENVAAGTQHVRTAPAATW